ncbi:MAG: C39 family peptidase [Peptostreptococcaceae bacterium]|nr:C39 family peptidase [Peptostreptococcaceae bacterium]
MNSSLATFAKLFFTFVSSFSVAFAGISLSLAYQNQVSLDWSVFTDKANSVRQTVTHHAENTFHNLLILTDMYADADSQAEKTLIYTAPAKIVSADASEKDIKSGQSSEGILLQGNIKNFIYYSQHDDRWSNYLYGNKDPMDKYGCGPTTLAMLLANLSKGDMTPVGGAQWASQNGYYATHSGSYHGIIADGANAFGLDSAAFSDYRESAIRKELEQGNVFGALMKPGIFSNGSGHFILILGLDEDGKVIIADSNSPENTKKTWELDTLLSELKYGASNGGPLWIIRLNSM